MAGAHLAHASGRFRELPSPCNIPHTQKTMEYADGTRTFAQGPREGSTAATVVYTRAIGQPNLVIPTERITSNAPVDLTEHRRVGQNSPS